MPDPSLIIVKLGWQVTRAHGSHLLGYGIVGGDDDNPGTLDFCGVAGLPVLIVSDDKAPLKHMQALVDRILQSAPRSLRAWRLVPRAGRAGDPGAAAGAGAMKPTKAVPASPDAMVVFRNVAGGCDPGTNLTPTGPRFPRIWLDEAKPNLANRSIVTGVLEPSQLVIVYGPPGDAKSFFTIDLSCHVAVGVPWRGRQVRGAPVVYVAAEAGASTARRFFAWAERHLGEAREERVPLAIITRCASLLEALDVEMLVSCRLF